VRFREFRLVESKEILTEGARIDHAEDIVFWEGSRGALRALAALESLEQGGHKDVTLKWDGSPAIIFGRDETGEFILTDKSGFTAKGYDGKPKSAKDLANMLGARKTRKGQEIDSKQAAFMSNMESIFDYYEKATPATFRGFFKGDLLYYQRPQLKNDKFMFTPNIVSYFVDSKSELGMKIGLSTTGVVVHRYIDLNGNESQVTQEQLDVMQGRDVLVVPPVYTQKPVQVDNKNIAQLETMVKQHAGKIDELLNKDELRQKQLTNLSDILYTYVNKKVDSSLANLGADFSQWITTTKLSKKKQDNVLSHIAEHPIAFESLWKVVSGIIKIKDAIINQLDSHEAEVTQKIGTQSGGEGYVMKHKNGDIKLVPREVFSKANRAKQR
jgi:hypothetical protein